MRGRPGKCADCSHKHLGNPKHPIYILSNPLITTRSSRRQRKPCNPSRYCLYYCVYVCATYCNREQIITIIRNRSKPYHLFPSANQSSPTSPLPHTLTAFENTPNEKGNVWKPSAPLAWGPLQIKWLKWQIPTSDLHTGILHVVEPLDWGMVQTNSEGLSQQIIFEGQDHPFDGWTLVLYCAKPSLSHQ